MNSNPTAADVVEKINGLAKVKGDGVSVVVFDGRSFEERTISGVVYDAEKEQIEIWIKEH